MQEESYFARGIIVYFIIPIRAGGGTDEAGALSFTQAKTGAFTTAARILAHTRYERSAADGFYEV